MGDGGRLARAAADGPEVYQSRQIPRLPRTAVGCGLQKWPQTADRGSKAGIHGQLQPSGTSPQQMAPYHQHPCGAGRETRHPPRPRCDGYSERAADRRIHSMHEATRAADATGGGKGGQLDRFKELLANFAVMRRLAIGFRGILRGHRGTKLGGWLKDARETGLYGI